MMRAFKLVGFSLCLLIGILALTWPRWLEGYAEDKMMAMLTSKFDEVEHGSFELTRTQVIVKDLTLSSKDAELFIPHLTVNFTPDWGAQTVNIHSVLVEGGNSSGTLEGFKRLRGSSGERKHPSRINLSGTFLDVKELEVTRLELDARGYTARGTLSFSSSSIQGPFEVRIATSSVVQNEDVLVSVEIIETTVDRDALWPLVLSVEGLATTVNGLSIQDVEGSLTVKDPKAEILAATLQGRTDKGQSWSFDGTVDRLKDTASGHLVAEGVLPSQLPIADLPLDPDHGSISVDLEFEKKQHQITVQGTVAVRDLRVFHKRLARDTVILGGDLELTAKADLSTKELVLESLTVQPWVGDGLSAIQLKARGRVLYIEEPSEREYELELIMEPHPCMEVLTAIPSGLLPDLQGFELGGDTTLDFKMVVKMADPDATVLEGGLETRKCKLQKVPPVISGLSRSFMHIVRMKNGQVIERPLMRGHAFYVPFGDLPGYVPAAVLATEDGSFWRHKGYRASAFRDSLRRNVELGTIRRGASTLTMQMVKNTLLTHERTLSRKLEELILTWVVEKKLSKERILEIYLNIVEFGPGIYGVAHAADHYFGKSATELSSLEAVFLATLLPRPIERHGMWCRGTLTPKHDKYIRRVHSRMLQKSKHMTQEEFDQSELDGVVFSRAGWSGEKACLAEGARMKSGKYLQGAQSGLVGEPG